MNWSPAIITLTEQIDAELRRPLKAPVILTDDEIEALYRAQPHVEPAVVKDQDGGKSNLHGEASI